MLPLAPTLIEEQSEVNCLIRAARDYCMRLLACFLLDSDCSPDSLGAASGHYEAGPRLSRRQVVEKSEHVAEMRDRLSLFGIRFSQVRNTDIRSANSTLSKQ